MQAKGAFSGLARLLRNILSHLPGALPPEPMERNSMTQIYSIKSAAMLCVATVAMCFAGQDANAQCLSGRGVAFGPSFGGSGISIGYTSGFRGINYGNFGYGYGGLNRGVSININRPVYGYSVYRPGTLYGGFYGRPVGNYGRGYGYGHGHYNRNRRW